MRRQNMDANDAMCGMLADKGSAEMKRLLNSNRARQEYRREYLRAEDPYAELDSQEAAELASVSVSRMEAAAKTYFNLPPKHQEKVKALLKESEGNPSEFEEELEPYETFPV